jgi:hypothetical protein
MIGKHSHCYIVTLFHCVDFVRRLFSLASEVGKKKNKKKSHLWYKNTNFSVLLLL